MRFSRLAGLVLGAGLAVSSAPQALAASEDGVFIQTLSVRNSGDISIITDTLMTTACSNKTWFALNVDAPNFRELYAAVLLAYSLNKPVNIKHNDANGCAFGSLALWATQIQLTQ